MILQIKWKFAEFPKLILTKDLILWQKPFQSGHNNYGWRILKEKYHMGQLYYRINGKWISKNRLNSSAYLVDEEIDNGMLPEQFKPFKL